MNDATHIRPLTGLRFFAAMWVILFAYWPDLQAGFTPALAVKGYLGVELFFVLSGFILCHVYLEAFGEGRFKYGSFLWNRLARVYPLHIATLGAVMAMGLAATAVGMSIDGNILGWDALPANLLLLHAWGFAPEAAFNHPSWSISAEWFAYLTFPAFAWAAWRLKDRPWLGAGLALGLLVILNAGFQALTGESLTQATFKWGALRIVPCFALGCAMHGLWRSGAVRSLQAGVVGACFMGAGALVAALSGAPDMLAVAGFGGLILCLAGMAEHGSRFGTGPIFVYLGEISYSIYMVCVPWQLLGVNAATKLLNTADDRLPWYVWILFTLAVIPLAAISYHLIERPARARMKLMHDSWARRRSVAAQA